MISCSGELASPVCSLPRLCAPLAHRAAFCSRQWGLPHRRERTGRDAAGLPATGRPRNTVIPSSTYLLVTSGEMCSRGACPLATLAVAFPLTQTVLLSSRLWRFPPPPFPYCTSYWYHLPRVRISRRKVFTPPPASPTITVNPQVYLITCLILCLTPFIGLAFRGENIT